MVGTSINTGCLATPLFTHPANMAGLKALRLQPNVQAALPQFGAVQPALIPSTEDHFTKLPVEETAVTRVPPLARPPASEALHLNTTVALQPPFQAQNAQAQAQAAFQPNPALHHYLGEHPGSVQPGANQTAFDQAVMAIATSFAGLLVGFATLFPGMEFILITGSLGAVVQQLAQAPPHLPVQAIRPTQGQNGQRPLTPTRTPLNIVG
jgi:hypothetical protein